MLAGGCFCGDLRYEADGEPYAKALCHCEMCRRTTGAPAVAWFTVRRGGFRMTGTPVRFASSERVTRGFCGRCGAQLTFETAGALDEIDISTASLDDPGLAAPERHIWVQSRLDWMTGLDDLPAHVRESASPTV